MIQQIKNDNFTLELEKWTNDYIKLFPYNFIEKLQFDGTMLSNHSCKAFSEKHNKIMVLNQIGFSKNYSLDCFINDLMQYKNVELHENILKLVDLNNINFNDNEEVFTDHDKNVENKDKSVSETEDLDTVKLLKNYTELYNDIVKELSLISSIIATLKKALNEDKLLNNQNNILSSLLTLNIVKSNSLSSKISNRQVNNEKILYDLNQLFITQFNINGISKNTLTSMIYNIMKYIDNNKQNANDIFKQYYNHQNRFYFTSIIGFFYEYGIGTTINYFKAFEMYKQSSDDFCPTSNNFTNNLLKDNQIIGLISLDYRIRTNKIENASEIKLTLPADVILRFTLIIFIINDTSTTVFFKHLLPAIFEQM
ncbi:9313_t:CDS:2, partial [Gigaspora margarita]